MSALWEGHESRVLVAAHRGGRFTAPENTMSAFRRAIAAGVDMIETDVRMTADGELVLMHDAESKRATVAALPSMIQQLREQGFAFDRLTPEVKPVLYGYRD